MYFLKNVGALCFLLGHLVTQVSEGPVSAIVTALQVSFRIRACFVGSLCLQVNVEELHCRPVHFGVSGFMVLDGTIRQAVPILFGSAVEVISGLLSQLLLSVPGGGMPRSLLMDVFQLFA